MYEDFDNDDFENEFSEEFIARFRETLYEEILKKAKAAADELETDGDFFVREDRSIETEVKIQFLENALKLLEEVEEFERCSIVLKYKKILEESISK